MYPFTLDDGSFGAFLSSVAGSVVEVASEACPAPVTGRIILVDDEPFPLPDRPDAQRRVLRVLVNSAGTAQRVCVAPIDWPQRCTPSL